MTLFEGSTRIPLHQMGIQGNGGKRKPPTLDPSTNENPNGPTVRPS